MGGISSPGLLMRISPRFRTCPECGQRGVETAEIQPNGLCLLSEADRDRYNIYDPVNRDADSGNAFGFTLLSLGCGWISVRGTVVYLWRPHKMEPSNFSSVKTL
jgi:hypothetical protein